MVNPKEITQKILEFGCSKCREKNLKARMWVEKIDLYKTERQQDPFWKNENVSETYEVTTNCMYSHRVKLYSTHYFSTP